MALIQAVAAYDELIVNLAKALGINFPFSKLVLEADVANRDHVKVYVVAPADRTAIERMVEAVKVFNVADVDVQADASVVVTPHPSPE